MEYLEVFNQKIDVIKFTDTKNKLSNTNQY